MKSDSELFDRPALMLAPLAGYTDPPFRKLCFDFGVDFAETEMVSSEGLARGCERTARLTEIFDGEDRVGIQIFGSNPSSMARAASAAAAGRPAFIDINCGCPVKKVVRKNGGAGLMRDLDLMGRIAASVTAAVDLPVTAKIRSGWDAENANFMEAGRILQDCGIAAVTIHPRYRSQMFRGDANWEHIAELNRELEIPVIANGDIRGPGDMKRVMDITGCRVVMVGRAALGQPWLFARLKRKMREITGEGKEISGAEAEIPDSLSEKLKIFEKFVRMEVDYKGERLAVMELKKHYRWYVRGVRGMKKYRGMLAQSGTLEEVLSILHRVREELNGR